MIVTAEIKTAIKALMEQQGWSYRALGRQLGIDGSAVSRWFSVHGSETFSPPVWSKLRPLLAPYLDRPAPAADLRAILTAQAAELPDVQAVVDRLRYWGELLDRCDNDDTRRAFLQARVSQVTVQADRSVRLALVMTNEEVWQPRLELVITIAATAG